MYQDNIEGLTNYEIKQDKYKDLKYILFWTNENDTRNMFGEGQISFFEYNCSYANCYLTTDKYLINDDYTKFEAIIFDVHDLQVWNNNNFPSLRSYKQKYIFYGKESSDDIPICSAFANKYFNWTWSYKLDSDIVSPFIEVKDFQGNIVAPKRVVDWETNMTLLSEIELVHLKQKKKAMAWINKKCHTRNNRMKFAKRLQRAFKENLLDFDIYGCGQLDCRNEKCLEAIKRDYYFYFAPEDSNTEDYVSAEVITAYNQFAVPIVVGGANYHKFLPEGSYINAGTTSIDKLVALVEYIIKNPKIYHSFHRWRNHYIISKAGKFKGICEVCEYLNNVSKYGVFSVRTNFRKWWYSGPLFERCFPKSPENLSDLNNSKRLLQ
ncbi:unnamed protein product [Euphydryas editha]|nr:unnamed protein product [Euphydryas editha]